MTDPRPLPLVEAMSNLIANQPFFAVFLTQQMRVVYRPDTKTAATDGKNIFVGDWFLARPVPERVFVLAHEVLHAVFDHMARSHQYALRGFGMDLLPFSHGRANLAMDAVINAALLASQIGQMPQGGVYRCREDMERTWDDVYIEMDEPPEGQDPQGFDEHLPPAEDAPTDVEIKQAATQAMNAAKEAGKLPAALQRLLGDILEPKLSWKQVLREFVVSCSGKDESSWRRLNRRRLVIPPGIPLPGRDGCQIDCAVIAVDTSGSISPKELAAFTAEVKSILTDVRPREAHLIWWDTAALSIQIEEPEDLETQNPYGGGGTDYDCVFREIQALELEPTVVICLTDGYVACSHDHAPWPHITVTTGADMPFGKNVRLEV